MKNQLTKTLICGVMATTFFLINCQKAPSRGVKAKAGAGETATANKLEGKVSVACTDTYLKAIDEARIAKDKIVPLVKSANVDKKDLSESEKSEMAKNRLDLIEKNNAVKAEIEKMSKGADGKVAEGCTTKSEQHLFSEKIEQMDSLVIDAGKLVGADDEAQRTAVNAKANRQQVAKTTNQFTDGSEFLVSAQMAALMERKNMAGVIYFKNGIIIKENASFEKDKDDKTKTICSLSEISSEDKKIEALDQVKVLGLSAVKKVSVRSEVSFKLAKSDLFLTFKCLIADSKVARFASEIKNTFGDHLMTSSQRDTELKKSEAVARASEVRQAKAESVTAATDKVAAALASINTIDKEIADATTAKDDEKVKTLSEKRVELKKALDSAQEELASAKSELQAAISAEGHAAARS